MRMSFAQRAASHAHRVLGPWRVRRPDRSGARPRVYNDAPQLLGPQSFGRTRIDTATTSDFETVLVDMFAKANAEGEAFLDVTAKSLCKLVSGPDSSAKGMAVCCRLMRRMMIPGDNELSTSYGRNGATLLIRFRLPR